MLKIVRFSAILAVLALVASPVIAKDAAAPAAPPAPTTVKAGDMEITDFWAQPSKGKDSVDVFLSITNKGKLPETLTDAESAVATNMEWVGLVDDTKKDEPKKDVKPAKDKDGKDITPPPVPPAPPAPTNLVVAPGKTVTLTPKGTLIRLTDLQKSLKEGDRLTVALHFRRSPNAMLDVPVKASGGGSGISSWFK